MKIIFFCLALFSTTVFAQNTLVKKDTSFTTYGTFIKERKHYPFIEIAAPLKPKNVKELNNLVYKKIGERELNLDIFYPKNKKNNPAIILIHGGGWQSGDKKMCHAQAIALADSGFVTIAVEYRLSPEATYPAGVQDIKAAVRWCRLNAKKYHINTNQIAILGRSAGGQLAALVGTTNGDKVFSVGDNLDISDEVQAIIDIDGTLAFHHPESSEGKASSVWLNGSYEENPKSWEEAAPLTHVGKSTPPVLFLNSSIPRFHAAQNDFIKVLNQWNIYSEVYTFPNTPHPFWLFKPWFNDTITYTANFLNKVFK